ncbi:MAG: ROK family protein [Candidatus Omnitrophota bacterium]|nr:MAG: ROK family protein [Candidatus Omnitrophota bacterium]
MKMFLGVDWGGTYIKAGVVDYRGKIVKSEVFASKGLRKKQVFIREIKGLLSRFRKYKIRAVGIGAPGIIDTKKGFIYYLPNIPGWKNYPLRGILRRQLRLPIYIDNDANLFALAEASLGAGKGAKCVIFLTLGTGLGGAVILDGKILEAATSACELGHTPLSIGGQVCGCGGRGCIETFVGNKYLLENYRKLKKNKAEARGVKEIFQRALAGEAEATVVWENFAEALGMFLSGMVNIFNPEVIVFGGGISGAFRLFKPLVARVIKQQAMWPQVKGLKLVRAKLKDAGIIGAALLAKRGHYETIH